MSNFLGWVMLIVLSLVGIAVVLYSLGHLLWVLAS